MKKRQHENSRRRKKKKKLQSRKINKKGQKGKLRQTEEG